MTDLEKAAFKNVFESTLHLHFGVHTQGKRPLHETVGGYLKAIGQYNNFEPIQVLDGLTRFDEQAPKKSYNDPTNPNTGNRVYDVTVGRESSPVLYLKWKDCSDLTGTYDKRQMDEAIEYLRNLQNLMEFDEFDYEFTERPWGLDKTHYIVEHEVRLWWD